jgi:hypothetical protein
VPRPRLSYANVVATLALFIALGGTSYAVTQLPRNSVGNRQLKANAVSSAKIRPGAVGRTDLAASARNAIRGPRGPVGPSGADGAAGPAGPSETIQVRPADPVAIPAAAGAPATLASVTLSPGSWLLDGRATITNDGTSVYFDCTLQTAAGTVLSTQTAHSGTDAAGATGIQVAVQSANEVPVATQVLLVCHPSSTTDGSPHAYYVTLLATRVGHVENR